MKSVLYRLKRALILGSLVFVALSTAAVSYAQDSQSIDFSIDAQPMGKALTRYSQQSGIVVIAPAELVEGKTAPAIIGEMLPQQALEQLLSGSGLESRLDNGVITIQASGPQASIQSPQIDSPQIEERTLEVMTVTGSRIAGASDSGAIAVTVMDSVELDALGESGVGDMLANLPQAGSFEINDSSEGVNSARGDVATVNLRGLGTGNTLILLNGRRLAAHGINQDVGSVPRQVTNVNSFPSAAIDRVEVLRDGASALYGTDATAGVVNTLLAPDMDKSRFSIRYDTLEGTNSDELDIDFATGLEFNEGKTEAVVVASFFTRDGLFSSELGNQFNNVDKRRFLEEEGSDWAESSNFRNTSTRSPFGEFEVISEYDPVTGIFEDENVDLDDDFAASIGLDDSDLTGNGRFHAQPCGFDGDFRVQLGAINDDCMGIGEGRLSTDLRFDFNGMQALNSLGEGYQLPISGPLAKGRQLISDADRYNFYTLIEHDFDNGIQAFGDFLFYHSETTAQRAPSPFSIADGIIVPASNYYNPFGAVGSPNRLEGLEDGDVPDEGYDILIRGWRPVSGGPRIIKTESTTFRLLAGLRGDFRDWDWESALAYSQNETEDRENRFSKTLLTEALSRSTADALNPFVPFANSYEALQALQVIRTTKGSTSLFTADFRMSRSDLWQNWAGDIGMALGADFRNESYEDDQDARVDGTIQFDGNGSGVSDIVSQSPTNDSDADRNVFAAFAETLIPLMAERNGVFSNEMNLQLAARGEYFDDIEDGVLAPKVALSYFPVRGVNFRAAYSEGFRAPNLVQLNRGDISRVDDGDTDFVRENAIADPLDTGDANRRSVRISNPDLKPEDTETTVLGMTLDATEWFDADWLRALEFNVDLWKFEQTDVIDNFGVQEALAIDFVRQLEGSSNPNVVRAPVTEEDIELFDEYNADNPENPVPIAGQVLFVRDPYINLDSQEAEGFDIGLLMRFRTDAGNFDFRTEISKLEKLDIFRNEELVAIVEDPRFAEELDALSINQVKINGNPEWRGLMSLTWRKGAWGAGASARYTSGFFDTSADNVDVDGDEEDDFFEVDSYTRVNAYTDYRMPIALSDDARLRIRLGVNNVFDEQPPIADESRGYNTEVHSVRGREFYVQLRTDF